MNAMKLTHSAPSLKYQAHSDSSGPAWRHPDHVVLEICVEDVEGVRIAAREGADRVELGDNLTASGTTSSIGTIEAAIFAAAEQVEERRALAGPHWTRSSAAAPFGLRVLIRPRGGCFVYDADEGRAMIADVRRIAALAREMSEFTRPQITGGGAFLPPAVELGFVIGALTPDGAVDRGLVRLLMGMAEGAPVTFHRAFDEARDPVEIYGDLGGPGTGLRAHQWWRGHRRPGHPGHRRPGGRRGAHGHRRGGHPARRHQRAGGVHRRAGGAYAPGQGGPAPR